MLNSAASRPMSNCPNRVGTLMRKRPFGLVRPSRSTWVASVISWSGPDARSSSNAPSSVRWMARAPRSNKRTPNAASSAMTLRERLALGRPLTRLAWV